MAKMRKSGRETTEGLVRGVTRWMVMVLEALEGASERRNAPGGGPVVTTGRPNSGRRYPP